jgi:hypothetical protein
VADETVEAGGASDPRRVEVYRDGRWRSVPMPDLVVGERFRMFESTGEAVDAGANYKLLERAVPHPELPGRWQVQVAVLADQVA